MKIVLLGGGGHCRSCVDAIRSAKLDIAGVIDPDPAGVPAGLRRLGDDTWLERSEARDCSYLVTVGQVAVSPARRELFSILRSRGLEVATVFARTAIVSGGAVVGGGTAVLHGAVINTGVTVGENCIINTGAIIEHDVCIGDHCHVSTGAIINGGATIGAGCMIGSGSVVLQGIKIAGGAAIGAGAVVTKDVDRAGTWVGVPARRLS